MSLKPYYEEPGITLYHGDCREILPQLKPDNVDLVLTDPPYGHGEDSNYASRKRGVGRRGGKLKGCAVEAKEWGNIKGYNEPFDPSFLMSYKQIILWGGNHFASRLPDSSKWLIWDKRDGVASDDNADCEIAWTNLKGPARVHHQLWKGICRAGEENISKAGSKVHPFQKPLSLMRWCIEQAKDVDTILDPFMGSGTTAVAAKQLGRKCIGIEVESKYLDIAIERLRQGILI